MDKKIAAADDGPGGSRGWSEYREYPPQDMLARAADFRAEMAIQREKYVSLAIFVCQHQQRSVIQLARIICE